MFRLVEDKIVNLINEKPIDSQPKQDFLLNEYHRYDEVIDTIEPTTLWYTFMMTYCIVDKKVLVIVSKKIR